MKNENLKQSEEIYNRLRASSDQLFCACGSMYNLKCKGICRELHTKGGEIICDEVYPLDPSAKKPKKNKSKRKFNAFKDIQRQKRRQEKNNHKHETNI